MTSSTVLNSCRLQRLTSFVLGLFPGWKAPSRSRWIGWRWSYPFCCAHSSEIGRVDMKRVIDRFWSGVSVSLCDTRQLWRALLSCSTYKVLTECPQCVLSCQGFFFQLLKHPEMPGHFFNKDTEEISGLSKVSLWSDPETNDIFLEIVFLYGCMKEHINIEFNILLAV